MGNPYEVEHNIKVVPKTRSRRPDMSSFFSQITQIDTSSASHHNPHAQPTPVDVAATFSLLRQQYEALLTSTPSNSDRSSGLLNELISEIDRNIMNPPEEIKGVPQSYLDELERVPKKSLKKTDTCPICSEPFLDDEFPLVVELPCHPTHKFDLECVGPWLRLNGTCPLDRKELMKKKGVEKLVDEEEEYFDDMYA